MEKIVRIQSAGTDAKGIVHPITIEVGIDKGIGIHLVGLADAQVRESLLRVVTALQSLGYRIPGKKVVVNIAPASLYKRGTNYDLPIAIGILLASGQISINEKLLEQCVFSGELALDGTLRHNGEYNGYAIASSTRNLIGLKPFALIADVQTAIQAAPFTSVFSFGFDHLKQVIDVLCSPQHDADGYLIWNRPEWQLVEEHIEGNKNIEYPWNY